MQDKVQKLAKNLIDNVNPLKLNQHRQQATRIRIYYHPRNVFGRWRDSDEGKAWKQKQFETIGAVCPRCQIEFPTIHCFDIDHIKPLSKYPALATELRNLQLLCGDCNGRKGAVNS
jgi:5-methylcytosine-specific restriction endonuclease McrA